MSKGIPMGVVVCCTEVVIKDDAPQDGVLCGNTEQFRVTGAEEIAANTKICWSCLPYFWL